MSLQPATHTPGGMTAQELRDTLAPLQARRGYCFNSDEAMTAPLLEQLLATKDRYGYMACPCRLANGAYEADKDIICPCVYREADVREYGCCFCGLYVSAAWNEGHIAHTACIPDRRPPEKILGGESRPDC